MTIDHAALEQDLVAWVRDWNEEESLDDLDADTDLLATGLLDSLGLAAMVTYVEARTGTAFDYTRFDPSRTASIRTLLELCAAPGQTTH